MNGPTFGSLFSGIGGLDLGLERAGWRCAWQCESDEYRRAVLAERFPGVPCYEDIRDVGTPSRLDERGNVGEGGPGASTAELGAQGGSGIGPHLLCGGFPCQDVSVAGRRAGLAGERSGLFFEFARIADALRPRWVLVENVPGLLSSHGGRDFGAVLGTLADIGYGVAWRILDSRFFGVPQRRRRVFIVGALADGDPRAAAERAGAVLAVGARCRRHPPAGAKAGADVAVASLSGIGSGGPDDNDGQGGRLVTSALVGRYGKGADRSATDVMIVADPLSHGSNPNSNAAGRRREDDVNLVTAFQCHGSNVGPMGALRRGNGNEGGGVPFIAESGVRRLMPIECERLQGLPDGHTDIEWRGKPAPDSRRYAALGDAVTATVAEWIGRRLMEAA